MGDESVPPTPVVVPDQPSKADSQPKFHTVRILGDGIENPGSYKIHSDSTIINLIDKAGGLRKGAITETINWHRSVDSDLTLTIPTRETIRDVAVGNETLTNRDLIHFRGPQDQQQNNQTASEDIININKASSNQLQKIKGIGPVLSERIIDYRRENGDFSRLKNLKNILGIGSVTYQRIRARARIR